MEISSDLTLFHDKINHKCQCLQHLSMVAAAEDADRTTSEEGGVAVVEEAEVEEEEALIVANFSKTKIRK